MKTLNLETATIEELKSHAYDLIALIDNYSKQLQTLNNAIAQKQQTVTETTEK